MEALRQARLSYVRCHDCEKVLLHNKQHNSPIDDVKRFIAIAAKENVLQQIFSNPCILRILGIALTHRASTGSDLATVIKAFDSLEHYILLLVAQPWKPEYRKLKLYGGFYRTRIKSVLLEPEEIFFEAGYIQASDEVMVHQGSNNKMKLLMLALDCRIAANECLSVQEEYNKVKYIGKSLHSVVCSKLGIPEIQDRQSHPVQRGNALYSGPSHSGPLHSSKDLLSSNGQSWPVKAPYDMNTNIFQNLTSNGERFPGSSSHVIRNSVAPLNVTSEEKIPEFLEATIDEHMRESLKLVSQGPTSDPIYQGSKSEDWRMMRDINIKGNLRKNSPFPLTNTNTNESNPLSVNTFPPSNIRYRPNSSNPTNLNSYAHAHVPTHEAPMSIDEGIQVDYGSSKSLQDSFNQISTPKYNASFAKSFDVDRKVQGVQPTQISYTPYIHRPPAFEKTDSGTQNVVQKIDIMPLVPKMESMPPPIPSRDLKPNLPIRPANRDNTDGLLVPSIPAPPIPARGQSSNSEPIMRRDHLQLRNKSSSLKYGELKTATVYQAAQNRCARSMDMTPWQCQKCTSTNVASDSVCCMCSCSRRAPQNNFRPHSQTSMISKICGRCTFDNPPDCTLCGACNGKL